MNLTVNAAPTAPPPLLPISVEAEFRFNKPTCLACGSSVVVRITGTKKESPGRWLASSIDVDCTRTCTGIDDPDAGMRFQQTILTYINRKYRLLHIR